jgi:hypothetical protein
MRKVASVYWFSFTGTIISGNKAKFNYREF